jgi:hypothetical protein
LRKEYGGPADGDFFRERELNALIDAITGLLVQAVALEAAARRLHNSTRRGPGRPRDVIIPYLGPELLALFQRYNNRGGRQSIAISIDGKRTQMETGGLFNFIGLVIQPLNEYLTTELARSPLSAERLARFALENRRRDAQAMKQRGTGGVRAGNQRRAGGVSEGNNRGTEGVVEGSRRQAEKKHAETRQLTPLALALQECLAIPQQCSP